jgi:hypothetical protein
MLWGVNFPDRFQSQLTSVPMMIPQTADEEPRLTRSGVDQRQVSKEAPGRRPSTEKCEKKKQNNAFQPIEGDEEISFQEQHYENTTRNLKQTLKAKRRAPIPDFFVIIQVALSDPRRHSGSTSCHSSSASPTFLLAPLPCILLINPHERGRILYAVGGRGPTPPDNERWGRKHDRGFVQLGPCYVRSPTKDQSISSSSRGEQSCLTQR